MATKDISDAQVCRAVFVAALHRYKVRSFDILASMTCECEKVVWRAHERAVNRDLLEYGTSIRGCWLTAAGQQLIGEQK